MKSGLKIFLAIIAAVILAGIGFFFWQRGPHLPRAQTPQPPGTFIPKNQLVFAGYKTPEAAVESVFWAFANGDYDTVVESFPPNLQGQMKKEFGNPKRFKSEGKRGFSQLKGVEIMARKNLGSDKVELKFQMTGNGGVHGKDGTNLMIMPAVKIGMEWKFTVDGAHGYTTNWDNSGDVVTFAN
jgi:hypothetical protein